MPESIHKRKERVRPPRVHITYETHKGDAMIMRELPFVLGVLADLSGHRKSEIMRLKERSFESIDRDNFDEMLRDVRPRLALRADNTLADDGSEISFELEFEKLEDFSPGNVAKQIEPLNKLVEARSRLKDLLSRMEANDTLEEMLGDAEVVNKVRKVFGNGSNGGDPSNGSTNGQEN